MLFDVYNVIIGRFYLINGIDVVVEGQELKNIIHFTDSKAILKRGSNLRQ